MIEKIEHIGIAVKNLDNANKIYEQILGTSPYKMETVDSEGVNTSFFRTFAILSAITLPKKPAPTTKKSIFFFTILFL